jgi:glucose/arabinose dehydrogenase
MFCGMLLVLAGYTIARGEVDQRPLDVRVGPAFPQLQWPSWITGTESGLLREPRPLLITGAGDGTDRLFVASQHGAVFVFPNHPQANEMRLFLDIRDRMQRDDRGNEEGFLGLAFHPRFRENDQFFVYYTAMATEENPHLSVISRFHVSTTDPNRADPSREEVLLTIKQPYWNHNGGTVVFGPDGYLYIGLGDGGAGGDPHGNGQNLQTLLGSILRIDVDHQDPGLKYAIPKDNPFAGRKDARGEIWAYGIRNAWRVTFDRQTGACWTGDVGQDTWEEIDVIRRGGNYGWNLREGLHSFGPNGSGPRSDLIEPIWEYHHDVGKSITGGHVYRGKQVPELEGAYLYADFVTGQIWALWYDVEQEQVLANREIIPRGLPVMSFGEDDAGEVYFTTQEGGVHKFVSPTTAAGP